MGLAKPIWPILQPDEPLSVGLVAGFPLHEGSGIKANDLSGNNNNLAFSGSPSWVGSDFGSALSFSGSNSALNTTPINMPVDPTKPFTFGMWVNTTTYTNLSSPCLFANGGGGNARGILQFAGGGDYYFWGANADWDTGVLFDLDGKWHRVFFTYDGSTMFFYRDGKLAAGPKTSLGLVTAIGTLALASAPFGSGFVGKIADFFVSNRFWTAADAARDYFDSFAIYRKPSRWWEVPTAAPGPAPSPGNTKQFLMLMGIGT